MAGLGDLVVNLSANTAKFDKGISKSKGGLTDFATSATSLLNPVTAAFAAMAASAAATGLSIYGIAQRIETLAGVVDKANQTGLSAKFIQELGFAAEQSGVPIDSLFDSLKDMTTKIGEASLATDATATSLEQIGLNIEDLKKLKPEGQFLAIADAISKLPTVAEKSAAGIAIFGESAVKMVPMLSQGEDGIRSLMEQAKDLKIGISDEDLKSIATADNAMVRMKSSLSAVVSNIAVGLAPVFEQISNSLTGILPMISDVARGLSEGLASAMKIVGDLVDEKVMPPLKEFLAISADIITKWAAMDSKFEFLGKLLAAGFSLGIETIKLEWKQMLIDLMNYTAEKANALVGMLNPKTAAIAVSDWLNGQGNFDQPKTVNREALEASQLRFDNLIRELNGLPALAGPVFGEPSRPDQPQVTAEEAQRIKSERMAAMALSLPGLAAPGGKDANVAATEKQTKDLVGALKSLRPPAMTVVPEF
jgi:hypothetical protein